MLLINVPGGAAETMTEIFAVPHVHLKVASRDAIREYSATAKATAELLPSRSNDNARAPKMADFSSRGPSALARGALACQEHMCMMSRHVGSYMPAPTADECLAVYALVTGVHSCLATWIEKQS